MAIELEFRDGIHAVPNHVAWLMKNVDTSTMTVEEAIRASERQKVKEYLNNAQRKLIGAHFREYGR